MPVARNRFRMTGFSLVELMVGMVLGLILIGGAVSIYLASKQSYVEVEQVAALTENARFAEQIIGDSLRHVGFLGEVPPDRVESDLAPPPGDCDAPARAYNDLRPLVFAVTVGSAKELECISDGREGTDVLVIKHVLPRPLSDRPRDGGSGGDSNPGNGVIDSLQDGRVYVMTNSVGGRLFDGATPPSITTGGEFPDGTAWEYQYEVFYIRQPAPTDIPRLARRLLSYNTATSSMEFVTEDLAEGVEELKLLFGYDSDNNGEVDTYSSLADIGDNWSKIESLEVFMLVRNATEDMQYTDHKTYKLGSEDVPPKNDHYRRLISHSSVSLRNLKLIIRGEA
jgi:type IV pilus assembly protein PilW